MKNLLLVILINLGFVFNGTAAYVTKAPTINALKNEKAIVLNLYGMVADVDVLSIRDFKGQIIYTGSVNGTKNRVKYDLTRLPLGNYEVEVKGANFMELHDIVITSENIKVIEKEAFFKPILRATADKLLLDALFLDEEKLYLSILDKSGNLVYDFSINSKGDYHKAFDLSQLQKGEYKAIVSTDHFVSTQEIELK